MIRVLRVLEYEYRDLAHYEADSANWTTSLPTGGYGQRQTWSGPRMVSDVVRVQEIPITTPLPPPPRCTSRAPRITPDGRLHLPLDPQCVLPQGHEGWHRDNGLPTPMEWTS